MGQITSKLRKTTHGFSWWCPGCDEGHPLPYERAWTFDGNLEAPTFTPSFLHSWKRFAGYTEAGVGIGEPAPYVCHYIVTKGQVAYCDDCTHALAGQTIAMPDLPPHMRDTPSQ